MTNLVNLPSYLTEFFFVQTFPIVNAALYSLATALFNLDPEFSRLTSYLRNRIEAGGVEVRCTQPNLGDYDARMACYQKSRHVYTRLLGNEPKQVFPSKL